MEHKKVIGNVNILDLRKATEASVADIEWIGNVNLLLYTPETAHLVHDLNIRNVNVPAEVTTDMQAELIMGPLSIGKDHFAGTKGPLGLLVMGPVTISPDLKADDLERGLGVAMVMGPVTVPEPLAGVIQSRIQLVMGPVESYPVLEKVHMGNLTIDRTYLESLEPGTELTVVGSASVQEGNPEGLFRKRIAKLHVTGRVTCFDSNVAEVGAALTGTSGPVRAVPSGFKVIAKETRLSRDMLASLVDRKLCFTRDLVIEPDVDETSFAQKIDGLACSGLLTSPRTLRPALAKICDLLNTETLFYEGELWEVHGATRLHPGRFDYLEGKATLVVTGDLEIDPDVTPEVLAERIDKVHLYGVIECSLEQQAALESRLGEAAGVFDRLRPEPEPPAWDIANANYLVL